jgi:ribosomal-protein-alanine N-acetyltransferase
VLALPQPDIPPFSNPTPLQAAVQLQNSHLEACLRLDHDALQGLWTAEQWQTELNDADRLCLGIPSGEHLLAVACGWLVVDELQISLVAVAPEHRRLGLGRRVLVALLKQAHAQGAQRATLEVASCNQGALALYQRCGFKTAGSRRGYYSDGRDALIQWCELSGNTPHGEPATERFG